MIYRWIILNKSLEIEFNLDTYTFMGYVYGLSGKKEKARKIIEQLKSKYQNTHHISHKLAVIYSGLKEKETACIILKNLSKNILTIYPR